MPTGRMTRCRPRVRKSVRPAAAPRRAPKAQCLRHRRRGSTPCLRCRGRLRRTHHRCALRRPLWGNFPTGRPDLILLTRSVREARGEARAPHAPHATAIQLEHP
eukprot:scaffold11341_cov36-Phaeocystis_antarctica.AAC.2